jgi:argininosuccinate synthase
LRVLHANSSIQFDRIFMSKDVKKVVLAYSGGLDTSIILKWLQTTYGCEVVTFTADLGQGEELEPARQKALLLGIKPENIFIEDVREEFVRDYVFPMFRANAVYEGQYLLGTSIARPLIAKKQIELAEKLGADAVSHGATGKGNDQVRYELAYFALKPDVTIIAPWREWDLRSREQLIAFAEAHQIPIAKDKRGEAPFSVDANLLHASSEGKVLEDPAQEVPDYVYSRTIDPEKAPDKATTITIDFEKGDATAIDGKKLSPATLLAKLNELGRANGIGRLDLVENRFVGMKSRGMYETPGGTILLVAHRGIESITLDRGAAHLKDELMPKYAELVYNGFWFAPEREMLQAAIDHSQQYVTGRVRLKLYKGNVIMVSRESKYSLYDQDLVTFEEGAVAYDHRDAAGFIKLNALRLRTLGQRKKKLGL